MGSTGSDSLYEKSEPYVPDFSVKAASNLLFLRIRRAFYIAARRSTLLGQSVKVRDDDNVAFSKEWKKATFLSNLSSNCDPNMHLISRDQDMRRTSSLTVPFTDIHVEKKKDSSNWSVPEAQSNGINIDCDEICEDSPPRERSETDPVDRCVDPEGIILSEGRKRSGTEGSGDSLGWECKNAAENSGEQVPLIARKGEANEDSGKDSVS